MSVPLLLFPAAMLLLSFSTISLKENKKSTPKTLLAVKIVSRFLTISTMIMYTLSNMGDHLFSQLFHFDYVIVTYAANVIFNFLILLPVYVYQQKKEVEGTPTPLYRSRKQPSLYLQTLKVMIFTILCIALLYVAIRVIYDHVWRLDASSVIESAEYSIQDFRDFFFGLSFIIAQLVANRYVLFQLFSVPFARLKSIILAETTEDKFDYKYSSDDGRESLMSCYSDENGWDRPNLLKKNGTKEIKSIVQDVKKERSRSRQSKIVKIYKACLHAGWLAACCLILVFIIVTLVISTVQFLIGRAVLESPPLEMLYILLNSIILSYQESAGNSSTIPSGYLQDILKLGFLLFFIVCAYVYSQPKDGNEKKGKKLTKIFTGLEMNSDVVGRFLVENLFAINTVYLISFLLPFSLYYPQEGTTSIDSSTICSWNLGTNLLGEGGPCQLNPFGRLLMLANRRLEILVFTFLIALAYIVVYSIKAVRIIIDYKHEKLLSYDI